MTEIEKQLQQINENFFKKKPVAEHEIPEGLFQLQLDIFNNMESLANNLRGLIDGEKDQFFITMVKYKEVYLSIRDNCEEYFIKYEKATQSGVLSLEQEDDFILAEDVAFVYLYCNNCITMIQVYEQFGEFPK